MKSYLIAEELTRLAEDEGEEKERELQLLQYHSPLYLQLE